MIKYPLCVLNALCSTQQIPFATSISGLNTFLSGAFGEFKRATECHIIVILGKSIASVSPYWSVQNTDVSKINVCIYHIHVWIFIAMLLKLNYFYVVQVPWCICITFTINCLTSNELKAACMKANTLNTRIFK